MEEKEIVIATHECDKALYFIAKAAKEYDYIKLKFVDKYAPTVEYLINMLRQAFGWMEKSRGTEESLNTRCVNNTFGKCGVKEIREDLKCTEQIRINCKKYKPKYTNTIKVTVVLIEKAGGIRGL